ncbi:Putative uncharacterized protein [Lactobacillus delbrueckii subsp. lactis]|nr:Putative uncharacterized protein [Lactobacillus delbrueckii subsp. lactis]
MGRYGPFLRYFFDGLQQADRFKRGKQ